VSPLQNVSILSAKHPGIRIFVVGLGAWFASKRKKRHGPFKIFWGSFFPKSAEKRQKRGKRKNVIAGQTRLLAHAPEHGVYSTHNTA